MDTRIQFRIDEETKSLAQQYAQSQGKTLSDACRELAENLAQYQRDAMAHENWLNEQINQAFEKLNSGNAKFVTHEQAQSFMNKHKAELKRKRA